MALKQFDNWLNEIKCPKWNHREVCIAEDTWKAALQCVRDRMLPNCHEPMDIYDFIEEELDDEN